MAKNTNLHIAKDKKNDEFYTQISDIENELRHYKKHFKDKVVYCNCDDPTWSEFWRYFHLNFNELGLKKLISTHYDKDEHTYKLEYFGENDNDIEVGVMTPLKQNGDFESDESIELLKEADIVVTNPPFSKFRSYIHQLMQYDKKFLIIGNKNAITYKEFFPLLKENKVWLGYTSPKEFVQPDGSVKKFGNIGWFTNLDIDKRHEELILWKKFNQGEYQMYDNYPAWNVDKVSEIPVDESVEVIVDEERYKSLKNTYLDDCLLLEEKDGLYRVQINNPIYGTPITILDKFCPAQFEIISFRKGEDGQDLAYTRERENSTVLSNPYTTSILGMIKNAEGKINGKPTYARITIRKK